MMENDFSSFTSSASGSTDLGGNIVAAPLYNDASMRDFSLSPGSPAIDAGNNGYVTFSDDFSGSPRITNGTVDMGAMEYQSIANCLASDSLALVALYNATDGPNWTNTWDLSQPVSTWYGVSLSVDGCNVIEVHLANNQLTGSIPTEIGNLNNLITLHLPYNQLTGNIPMEIGNLYKLSILHLSNNQLTGSIPTEIGNLITNLKHVFISHNQLNGNIPMQIGNLTNLKHLNLNFNQFTGSIPTEIGNLINLESLALNNNQLSGNIPTEIGNFINLEVLFLNDNQLTGSIPTEIGNLINLESLSLLNNQLSGNIPMEIGNLTNLTYLYLENNQLTGSIPNTIGNLTNLKYFYLSQNQLSGSIPNTIGNLINLGRLSLDNNQLTGCYPQSLCNLILFYYNFSNNSGLPDNGSDQGFQGFCAGTAPPCNANKNALSGLSGGTLFEKAQLGQNAPNPFQENTMIEYYLPKNANSAKVTVYDYTGRMIKEINVETRGHGQVDLQLSNFASGTYLYALIIDDKMQDSKKMILK